MVSILPLLFLSFSRRSTFGFLLIRSEVVSSMDAPKSHFLPLRRYLQLVAPAPFRHACSLRVYSEFAANSMPVCPWSSSSSASPYHTDGYAGRTNATFRVQILSF